MVHNIQAVRAGRGTTGRGASKTVVTCAREGTVAQHKTGRESWPPPWAAPVSRREDWCQQQPFQHARRDLTVGWLRTPPGSYLVRPCSHGS